MYGGQNTYIPLKVNQSGVVPIIFASSVLLLPVLLSNMLGGSDGTGWRATHPGLGRPTTSSTARTWSTSASSRVMIVAFAYFYNSIAFDPIRQADQIRRQGGFIPGIRPGPQTERYLGQGRQPDHAARCACSSPSSRSCRTSSCGSVNVQSFPFAGTTVLIAVGVALELMRQIDSQLMLRNYEGFLK